MQIWINGKAMTSRPTGLYTEDACYQSFQEGEEELGDHAPE